MGSSRYLSQFFLFTTTHILPTKTQGIPRPNTTRVSSGSAEETHGDGYPHVWSRRRRRSIRGDRLLEVIQDWVTVQNTSKGTATSTANQKLLRTFMIRNSDGFSHVPNACAQASRHSKPLLECSSTPRVALPPRVEDALGY